MTRLSPKSEAAAFRIWAYCQEREWNCTVTEIAEGLDMNPKSIGRLAQEKGWISRLRVRKTGLVHDNYSGRLGASNFATDHILDGGSYAQALRAIGVPERGACLE